MHPRERPRAREWPVAVSPRALPSARPLARYKLAAFRVADAAIRAVLCVGTLVVAALWIRSVKVRTSPPPPPPPRA